MAVLLMFCTIRPAAGEPVDPVQLLRELQIRYESMRSYSATGDVTSVINISEVPLSDAAQGPARAAQESHHRFTIKLGRPELYRIEWKQQMPSFTTKGALWSDGSARVLTVPGQKSPVEPQDTQTALAMATGISGGVANTIPSAFFAFKGSSFTALTDTRLDGEETIEGDPCYVIKAHLADQGVTLWISKATHLLRQKRHDFARPRSMPELGDDDVRRALESWNREASDEAIKAMRAQLEAARAMMNLMSGYSVEVHRDIRIDVPVRLSEFRIRKPSRGHK